MMRMRFEKVAVEGLAAFAVARAVTAEAVTGPAMNRVLERLVQPAPPGGLFDAFPDPQVRDRCARLLAAQLLDDLKMGRADLRALHRDGWTHPRALWAEWLADLLTCPVCLSFHAAWVIASTVRRPRPWKPAWWVGVFAGWAVASQLARQPWNPSPSEAGVRITNAVNAATKEASAHAVHGL